MKLPIAYWSVSLDIECPNCNKWLDLMSTDDLFERVKVGESVESLAVECGYCGVEFNCATDY